MSSLRQLLKLGLVWGLVGYSAGYGVVQRVPTRIFPKFAEVPVFDTISGNILHHAGLDQDVYDLLAAYGCDSLSKWFSWRTGDNLCKWYVATFPDSIDVSALGDSLLKLDAIDVVDYDDTGFTRSPTMDWPPDDPGYDTSGGGLNDLFRLLNLDSALMVESGSPAVAISVYSDTFPFEWGHPDLISNLWINPAEDLNSNGTLEPWPSDSSYQGITGDFDGEDAPGDNDNLVDNIIGFPWDMELVRRADSLGSWHDTRSAGIAAAQSNTIGGLGACPECRLASMADGVSGEAEELNLIAQLDLGIRVFSRSFTGP